MGSEINFLDDAPDKILRPWKRGTAPITNTPRPAPGMTLWGFISKLAPMRSPTVFMTIPAVDH
jgi:hypothetical protein